MTDELAGENAHTRSPACTLPTCTIPTHWPTSAELAAQEICPTPGCNHDIDFRASAQLVATVLDEALAVVKHACDVECQSPGTHRQCSSHEPFRALAQYVGAPSTWPATSGGQNDA